MKKVIILTLICLGALLSSCGNDDNEALKQDPFVGVWLMSQNTTIVNGVETEFTLDACGKKSNITIKEDGTMSQVTYRMKNGTCEVSSNNSGSWEKISAGSYKVTIGDEEQEYMIAFNTDKFSVTLDIQGNPFVIVYTKSN